MKQTYSLTTPFDWLEPKLEQFFDHKFWLFRVLFLALVISVGTLLFFNSIFIDVGFRGLYHEMLKPGSVDGFFWEKIIDQGNAPFTPKGYADGTHEANRTFRLTIPLISRLLHLNVTTLYLLHVAVGLLFLAYVTRIVDDILKNRVLTFYFMTGFTAIYAGANFYINYMGHADSFALCFMALTFYYRNPLSIFLFSQLTFWCDERAILNSSYVGLWIVLPFVLQTVKTRKFKFNNIPISAGILILSVAIYLIGRQWLAYTYHLHVGHDSALSQQATRWSFSILGDKFTRGLEGFWLIIFAGMGVLIMAKDWWRASLLSICWLVTCGIAFVVADGTRALSFGFPMFFFMMVSLKEHISTKQIKYLLIISTGISLMLPLSFP